MFISGTQLDETKIPEDQMDLSRFDQDMTQIAVKMFPPRLLFHYFPTQPSQDHIHIVVEVPAGKTFRGRVDANLLNPLSY